MKTTVNITPKGIAIETDDMLINIEAKSADMASRERSTLIFNDIADAASKIIKSIPKEENESKKPTVCIKCGKEFIPNGPRQLYCCKACGLKPKPERDRIVSKLKNKTLDPVKEAELQQTLQEIENRRHQPYQIAD